MTVSGDELSEGERLHRIEALNDDALAYLDADELLAELLGRLAEMLAVDVAVLHLLDESKSQLVVKVAWGMEDAVYEGSCVPVGEGFAGRIASERAVVSLDDVRPHDLVDPVLRERACASLLGAPLISQGEVTGVLYVGSLAPRAFLDEDVDLLHAASGRMALAVQAGSSRAQLAAARMLQRSLLPTRLPPIAGLALAARYVPGEGGAVGGDWYDVFALPSGHVCMVVGDVAGHGLPAAVVMGRLRSALRAYVLTDVDPGRVVTLLDHKLRHFEASEMATLLCAVFDPLLDRVRLSSAGHPPAMLAAPGAATVDLVVPADPPLGAGLARQRRTTTFDIPQGALLCLYTDGLVERRGAHLDDGLDRLRHTLVAGDPDDACNSVMTALVGQSQLRDDVALLVIRREEAQDHHTLTLPAEPGCLTHIRVALRRWLVGTGASQLATDDLVTAVGEAASNSIKHAYGPAGGTIEVELVIHEGEAAVTVRDTGRWRPAQGAREGRGMQLMERCSDEVQVVRGLEGTEVTIRRQLRREDDA